MLVPPNPGNVSAFGLLTVDVKNDYVQTHVTLADQLDPATVAGVYDALAAQAAEALAKEGFDPSEHQFVRTADLRYFGQAFEVRVPVPAEVDAATRPRSPTPSTPSTARSYGYDFSGDPTQQVEWVNLRVSGIGPIQRPEIQRATPDGRGRSRSAPPRDHRRRSASTPDEGYVETPVLWRPDLPPGHGGGRPGDHRGVRLHGAAAPGLHRPRRRVPQPHRDQERE